MTEETPLDVSASIEIEVQIDHGGLHVVMAEVVADVGDGVAFLEHIDGAGVPEAVHGMDVCEAFGR